MRLQAGLLIALCASPFLAAQTTASPEKSAGSTLHAAAKLVVVDVVVSDGHGDPVKGLKPSDFHVTEGKTSQTIRNFDEHTGIAVGIATQPPAKLEPNVFTNAAAAPVSSEINVLLLDMVNTPMMDQSFVRGQLLKYLTTAKPGTRIAIFGLTTKLIMLQGFTSDIELLRRAVENNHPTAPPLMAQSDRGEGADAVAAQLNGIEAQLSITPEIAAALAEFDDVEKNVDLAQTAQYTLQALNQLGRYLAGIPGRKNLIWFSEAFPINFLPTIPLPTGGSTLSSFAGKASWETEYRETANLLARSRVAVYPIDARGLMPAPFPGASFRNQRAFSSGLAEAQSTMYDLADQTGGKAFTNTNGLAQAVEKVVDTGSNYYTLTYAPTDSNARGEFRAIHIQLDSGSYKLAYRRGYYADANASSPAATDPIKAAELFVTPPATQIPFYARVLPLPPDAAPVVAPGDKPRPRLGLDKDSVVRYRVDCSADPRNLSISSTDDGLRHGHLEFVVLAYDSVGRKISSNVKSVQTSWNAAQFTVAQQQGVRYQQEISVPATGEYSLRIIIHDLLNGQIGAIDVPLTHLPKP